MRPVLIQGLSLDSGQSLNGLKDSFQLGKGYFSALKEFGLEWIDCGDSQGKIQNTKVYSENDLDFFDLEFFEKAYIKTRSLYRLKYPLVNWGGDHSVALASVGAFLGEFPRGKVLWVDAHADLNLPDSSSTGNFHGMPVSQLMDLSKSAAKRYPWLSKHLSPENIIYLGLRDLDPFEISTLDNLGIRWISAEKSKILGSQRVAEEIINFTNGEALHISFDVDALSPEWAPSTGVQAAGGLELPDFIKIVMALRHKEEIKSLDIVELNPFLGSKQDVNKSYGSALQVIGSFFKGIESTKGIHDRACPTA